MSLRDRLTSQKENEDPNETQARCMHDASRFCCCCSAQHAPVRARQAIRSFRHLRDFLSVYMFQAWCDAYVGNAAYTDPCEAPGIGPDEGEIPSEEVMLRLVNDTIEEEHVRRAFDYGVFELLWPRRDTSMLEDMTRLVLTFAALLAQSGHSAVHLHIDLVYRTEAGSTGGPERRSHVASLRYRDRLWAASQIADILLESV